MITFKQIQLNGFKSFADKTTIPLGEGVTCIVGPNGCGKSNVADAIRWVLGEQSAKMMRGSQMLDVIFGGTETRRMTSFCEVTLTFDNSNRVFDIDCDEVEMTRRLYRDGTSEYLLNKEPSRMKVLTGLLHGAGAAKEGYSIIGQGRIEQIMNAKPEDRRSIFEEATGIVVFKDRKAEVERKIAASKDNLFIQNQRLLEVERSLSVLKRAADNARRHRELFEEMRRLEMNLYIARHDGAAGAKAVLAEQDKALGEELKALEEKLSALLAEYGSCRDSLTGADAELQEINDRIRQYAVGMERKSGEARLYTEKARAVQATLTDAQENLVYSAKRIDDIDKEIRRAEALAARNSDRVEAMKAEAEELRKRTAELSGKISEYEYMTGEHRKKVLDAFKDLTEMRQNMGSLSAQKALLGERLAEISDDMEKIHARRDALRTEYEGCVSRSNAVTEFLGNENALTEEAEKKSVDAENKLRNMINQIYDARAQIDSLNSSLETCKALRDRFDGYTYSVKKLLGDSRNDPLLASCIKGLIADVVSCGKEFEVAIETAFGGAMQNVITGTREEAQRLIEYLKRTRSGQVTFLPVEAMKPRYENDQIKSAVHDKGALGFAIDLVKYDKKFENIIHNLLGNTLIVDNILNARLIAARYPRAFKIVTLDGDQIAVSGSMTGGSKKEVAGNLLASERRIKELSEAIEAKNSFLARAAKKREELEGEKALADSEADLLRKRLQDARVELAQLTEKQTSLIGAVTSAESEYAAYGQSVQALKSRLESLDSEYSGVSRGASDLSAQSDDASAKIDDMSAEYDKLTAERSSLTEKLNTVLVEAASLESAVKAGAENVLRLKDEREKLTGKIREINESIPNIKKQLEELNREAEKKALTEEEQIAVDGLRARLSEVNASKSMYNARMNEIERERKDSLEEKERLIARSYEIKNAVNAIDIDLNNLRERISVAYNADYEACLAEKCENFDPDAAKERIDVLQRQLAHIGYFDDASIEQYDEAVARHDRMIAEKEDLEKALDDLQKALDDIRAEMLKIFDEGFNIISENFKRTFKELFGGGSAELLLDYTDCDDPLNAGVEIKACPPGKKLTKISLLSGGERALTAIAILFAIIGMRPMPFCVLDEIEAALDEANVARYARYLKKFAQNTQFIVITHRKPTMENADILFGVTMEEKGVSKIVSVKLSEVEERLGGDTVM